MHDPAPLPDESDESNEPARPPADALNPPLQAQRDARPMPWNQRWPNLAPGVGLDPEASVVLALSGGADSVFLLHALSACTLPQRVVCVHVDHGLRAGESQQDAAFCERLCRTLGVEFQLRRVELSAEGSLEERAREARYAELFAVARAEGIDTILTGHHADDALETLLMRLLRGADLEALGGLPRATTWARGEHNAAIRVCRPLIHMRREEVRCVLSDWGLDWREDSSNRDARFTRNKIRHQLLPWIDELGGADALENLRAFGRAVEDLESDLARRTAHLHWTLGLPARGALRASRLGRSQPGTEESAPPSVAESGGWIARGELAALEPALQRRALWRLFTEATGRAPGRSLMEILLQDLATARCTRRALPGRFTLQLRSDALVLIPPASSMEAPETIAPSVASSGAGVQLSFEFASDEACERGAPLPLPGAVRLPDGRSLTAEIVLVHEGAPISEDPSAIELDAEGVELPLTVRWCRPGDRFHPLGAPGSKPLSRFLADAGVPREARERVPLVFSGTELLWAAGVRPCERHRVRHSTRRRLRLKLGDEVRPA